MSAPTCLYCSAALTPADLTDGWCDNCGKKLPASQTSLRPTATRSGAGLADAPRQVPGEDYWGYQTRSSPRGLATLGARFLGAVIDAIVAGVAFLPGAAVLVAGIESKEEWFGPVGIALLVGGLLLTVVVQFVLLSRDGQTIGKKLARTRIVNARDGSNPGFMGAVFLRNFVPALIGFIPCIGSIFSIVDILYIFGDDRRRLADLIAGTKVVKA